MRTGGRYKEGFITVQFFKFRCHCNMTIVYSYSGEIILYRGLELLFYL